jgi:hypothetical protein
MLFLRRFWPRVCDRVVGERDDDVDDVDLYSAAQKRVTRNE